jgi:hypothetical protein
LATETGFKEILVPDACSLLFSAQVELRGRRIFEWLLDHYEVKVCSVVKYECFNLIQKNRVTIDDPNTFKRELSKKEVRDIDCIQCLEYLKRYCVVNNIPEFPKIGDGEKNAIALSLYLNTKCGKTITFLTDDFDAIKTIAEILNEQKFAIHKSVPDIIIDLFKTDLTINENVARGALQTYYNLMKKAIVHERFEKRMKYNCRSFWEENCGLNCH